MYNGNLNLWGHTPIVDNKIMKYVIFSANGQQDVWPIN